MSLDSDKVRAGLAWIREGIRGGYLDSVLEAITEALGERAVELRRTPPARTSAMVTDDLVWAWLSDDADGGSWEMHADTSSPDMATICPQCNCPSYNSHDVVERYCGICHQFYDQMSPRP